MKKVRCSRWRLLKWIRRFVELQKKLAAANKKLEVAKAAARIPKNLDDKIYEIEDAIRLATEA